MTIFGGSFSVIKDKEAFLRGALIKGGCTFGTFQSIMLTYVHVLCSAMVYI